MSMGWRVSAGNHEVSRTKQNELIIYCIIINDLQCSLENVKNLSDDERTNLHNHLPLAV